MSGITGNGEVRGGNPWRVAVWSVAILLFLLPLVSMQLSDEVAWDHVDFAILGTILLCVGATFELTTRNQSSTVYRLAIAVALGASVLLIWINGAVGMIGSESNSANLIYGGALAIAAIGSWLARFRPQGMARAMFATAIALTAVAMMVLLGGLGSLPGETLGIVGLNGIFIMLFLASGLLFRRVARG